MQAVLVHGYKGFPENNWFPWLRRELEARGWTIHAPQLPLAAWPRRPAWIPALVDVLRPLDPSQTVLIGHSLGCVSILYALETLRPSTPFAAGVLCAGFGRDFRKTDRLVHWFTPPPDLAAIRPFVRRWTCVHSSDDPIVPFAEGEWLAGQLGADLVRLEGKGHLMKKIDGVTELPEALEAALGG